MTFSRRSSFFYAAAGEFRVLQFTKPGPLPLVVRPVRELCFKTITFIQYSSKTLRKMSFSFAKSRSDAYRPSLRAVICPPQLVLSSRLFKKTTNHFRRKVIPSWVDITAQIEEDEDAKKKLG